MHKNEQRYVISFKTGPDRKREQKNVTSKDDIEKVLSNQKEIIKNQFQNASGFSITNMTQSE